MRARRTALARFIDMSALWSLCLLAWFYWLLARLGRLYPALLMAIACAAATVALAFAAGRALRRRGRGAALSPEQVRALCEHMALNDPNDALRDMAAWLTARGKYAHCEVKGGAIRALRADGGRAAIALISAWPGVQVGAQELIDAWRRCGTEAAVFVASTASFTPEALTLARRLHISPIAPEALAELMRDALPLCGDARPRKSHAALRGLISRSSAGRFGAWALVLAVSGRLLGLPYFRAAGLICALIWLICAAQPRPPRCDRWS